MFEHALKNLNLKDAGLPSQSWLPVYESLQQAHDPDAEPWTYVAVPIWIRQLGARNFGLRVMEDHLEPIAEAGDILVVWTGPFGSIASALGERNTWISAGTAGTPVLTEDLSSLLESPRRRIGLLLAVLRPQGRSTREYDVCLELPAAASLGLEGSWAR